MSAADASSSLLTVTAAAECGQASSSNIVGKIERGKYQVRVESYSKSRMTKNGDYLTSSTYLVGGQSWRILYYPNGNHSSTSGLISLFLRRVGGGADDGDVRVDAYFDLVIQPGEAADPHGHGFSYTFWPDYTYGYPQFISPEKLENPAYLKDDSFTFLWDITVERPPFVVDVPPSTLCWHLGDLLGETEGADVTLDVGGETFTAHRYVLAARSLVFKAQLFGPMKVENGTTIRVDDMHPDVFRVLLHFIYTDELPAEGDDKDDGEAIMAQHLLVAADKYDLPRLKLICENKLSKRLDVSTVATTLALAEQHGCHGLKEVILRFLKLPSNMEAVGRTVGYRHLRESCPSLFISGLIRP